MHITITQFNDQVKMTTPVVVPILHLARQYRADSPEFNLLEVEDTLEKLQEAVQEQFNMFWDEYAMEENEKLSPAALLFAIRLRQMA